MGRSRSLRFVEAAGRRSRRASREAARRRTCVVRDAVATGSDVAAAEQELGCREDNGRQLEDGSFPSALSHGKERSEASEAVHADGSIPAGCPGDFLSLEQESAGAASTAHQPDVSRGSSDVDVDGGAHPDLVPGREDSESDGPADASGEAAAGPVDDVGVIGDDARGDADGEDASSTCTTLSPDKLCDPPEEVDAFILPEDECAMSPSADGGLEDEMLIQDPPGDDPGVNVPRGCLPAVRLPMPFKAVEHLYAYLLLRGQCHGTEELYDVFRAGFNSSSPTPLPNANTIRYNISPVVDAAWLLPTRTLSTRHAPSGKVVNVRYIAPSEHVRRDLLFDATFELFKKADRRTEEDRLLHPEFVDSPLFQDRTSVLMAGRLVPQFMLGEVQLSVGNRVTASLVGGGLLDNIKIQRAFFAAAQSGVTRDEAAHAGDFIVECCSVLPAHEPAGYFISRYWCAASLPLLTWHSQDHTVTEVLELDRVDEPGCPPPSEIHGSGTGAEPEAGTHPGAQSNRRLMWGRIDGEASLVVSLCFYSDGFGTQTSKEVTLGGVYMSYLSWLFQDRCSSHAARTVAVTPSGVDSDCVLEAITEDLREGARKGWLCRCADGSTVRVWADVAFFVGDYVQVAKTSNLMGPAANSPCTLCTYRLHGAPGCRFGLAGSSKSVEMMRTTARTTSVCVAARAWRDED